MRKIILTAALATAGFTASTAHAQGLLSLFGVSGNSCPPCAPTHNQYPAGYPTAVPTNVRPVTPYNTYYPNYNTQTPGYYGHSPLTPVYNQTQQHPQYHYPQYPQVAPTYNRAPVTPVSTPRSSIPFFNTGWW